MIRYLISRPPDFQRFIFLGIMLVISITLHEFAHALAAFLQGDDTAKNQGRLTINPLKHLDPFGSVLILLIGFGFGRPVPFAPNRLRNRQIGPALVAIAGPLTNILIAVVCASIYGFVDKDRSSLPLGIFLLEMGVFLNVLLALFNLIPIPPLDGSRILSAFLPSRHHRIIWFLDKWGFLLLLVVVWILPSWRPWNRLINAVTGIILTAVGV